MATNYACGHSNSYNPGHNINLPSLCYHCKMALVGTSVDFVRFGAVPESGRSWNHAESKPEAGVSVYLVQENIIRDTLRWEFADTRTMYIGKGIVLGVGGDDEIVVEITTIRKASKRDKIRLGVQF
jgi:hypothetical protein